MKYSILFTCLVLFQSGYAATQAPLTQVRPSRQMQSAACQTVFLRAKETAELAFEQLNARKSYAYLGYFNELDELLELSETSAVQAQKLADAIQEVVGLAYNYPFLEYTATIFDDLTHNKEILPCVLSPNSSAGQMQANHAMRTGETNEAVLILSSFEVSPLYFAMNFFGSVATLAGEHFLFQWRDSAFQLHDQQPSDVDRLYLQFASTVRPGLMKLEEGFPPVLMTLFQLVQTTELYQVVYPQQAEANRQQLAALTFQDLSHGRNSHLTGPVLKQLGITRTNILDKAVEIITVMYETIKKATPP